MKLKMENPKPIEEFLKVQGRFKHLFADKNKDVIVDIQNKVDDNLSKLVKRAEKS